LRASDAKTSFLAQVEGKGLNHLIERENQKHLANLLDGHNALHLCHHINGIDDEGGVALYAIWIDWRSKNYGAYLPSIWMLLFDPKPRKAPIQCQRQIP